MATAPTLPVAEPPDEPAPLPQKRRPLGRIVLLVVGVPLLIVAGAWGAFRIWQPHLYSGTVLQAPTAAPPLDTLTFTNGEPVNLEQFRGDNVVLFFGYTYCPDICPTTLTATARALDVMGSDADRTHVIMVSVDPDRDSPEQLGRYVTIFDPSFLGATGEMVDLERIASTYGVFFGRGEELGEENYAVDHTATLMGIGPDGHLRVVWPGSVHPDDLAADLKELL